MGTHNILRMHEGKYFFLEKNIRDVTALDLIKCLKQVKFRLTCATVNELPSNISTMILLDID